MLEPIAFVWRTAHFTSFSLRKLERDIYQLMYPRHDSDLRIARRLELLLIIFLALLSIAYLGKGFYFGIFRDGADVYRRWNEERFLLGGLANPRMAAGFARRGVVYPSWSYFSGIFLFWPPWPQVLTWYALVNLACLTWIIAFVAWYAREQSKLDRLLIVLSVTAIGAICTNLGVGNYGLIMLALLTGAYRADQAGRPVLEGLLLGVAMLKPQLAAPFLLITLLRGRFRAVAAAALYVVFATVAMWIISGIGPLLMLEQSAQMAGAFAKTTAGLLTVVLDAGVPYRLAAPLTALLCAAIFMPILWRHRDSSPMLLFAIAAVMSRLWTYNLNTSNLILVFLLLELWRLAIETRDMRATGLFIAVGMSLWVPASFSEHHIVQLAEHLTWLAGVIGLLILDTRAPDSEDIEEEDQIAAAAARR